MKIVKKNTKMQMAFREEVRTQLATDTTLVADTFVSSSNGVSFIFNNVTYAKGYQYDDLTGVYISGLRQQKSDIKNIEFGSATISVNFENSDNYFENFGANSCTIKGKFKNTILTSEEYDTLLTENDEEIIL